MSTNKHIRILGEHLYSNLNHLRRDRYRNNQMHHVYPNEGDVTKMSWDEYVNNSLWSILVDTVHSVIMYRHHKAYVRDVLLAEQPNISPNDLAHKLNISFGESLVIMYELQKAKEKLDENR